MVVGVCVWGAGGGGGVAKRPASEAMRLDDS